MTSTLEFLSPARKKPGTRDVLSRSELSRIARFGEHRRYATGEAIFVPVRSARGS